MNSYDDLLNTNPPGGHDFEDFLLNQSNDAFVKMEPDLDDSNGQMESINIVQRKVGPNKKITKRMMDAIIPLIQSNDRITLREIKEFLHIHFNLNVSLSAISVALRDAKVCKQMEFSSKLRINFF